MARDLEALLGFLAERAAMPFRWGRRRNDCVSFAANAVQAQTGRDPLEGLDWATQAEARALLRELGGLEAAIDARLTRIAPAMACRGDVAGVIDRRLGRRLMIVEGATLAGPGKGGVVRLPRREMITAWSIDPALEGAADV